MNNRSRVFLISLSLLSSLGYAGDVPEPGFTVELVNPDPVKPIQMPQVEFQHTHANGGGGGNSSSSVGSSTGGSIINLLSDLTRNDQPDWRIPKKAHLKLMQEQYGVEASKTGWPELFEMFGDLTIQQPSTATVHLAGFPGNVRHTPQAAAQVLANQRVAAAPVVVAPTPAPIVTAPAPAAPYVASSEARVISAPIPTTTATPAPSITSNNTSIIISSSERIVGGLAGTMPAIPVAVPTPAPATTLPLTGGMPKFTIHNPNKISTLNELMTPKSFVKPLPVPPSAPCPAPAPSGPSIKPEEAGMIVGAIAIAAPYIIPVAVVGLAFYSTYKMTGYIIQNLGKTLGKDAQEVATKAAKDSLAHRQIHETVHAPIATHTEVHTPVTTHITPHSNLPAQLQPSDNPLKLGKKIYQPGPQPGQGDDPHGYKDQWGHYRDYTPENVKMAIESVEKGVWHGQHPKNGKHIFTYDCPKTGLQKWAEVDNNGEILNCGINEVRLTVCPQTKKLSGPEGFVKPKGKGTGWVDKSLKAGVIGTALSDIYTSSSAPVFIAQDETLPDISFFPPAPRSITVHDLEAERMIKNHYVAMEQKKIEVIQNKINQGSDL